MTKIKHTPLPWKQTGTGLYPTGPEEHPGRLCDFLYRYSFDDMAIENAKFALRACNAHDKLISLLILAIERVKIANEAGDPILSAWRTDAEKIIAELEE